MRNGWDESENRLPANLIKFLIGTQTSLSCVLSNGLHGDRDLDQKHKPPGVLGGREADSR